jgi:hypothetical protein
MMGLLALFWGTGAQGVLLGCYFGVLDIGEDWMMDKEPSIKNNPLVRALARWENEGGSLDADREKRAASIQEEERILHCLGAAVIMNWNDLPQEIQRELFASAASLSEPLHTAELKEQIARFLHNNKDF